MITLPKKNAATKDRRLQSRRKNSRADVDWPVTVITDDGTHQGKTVNISRSGALICLAEQLAVGDSVRLAIEIPDCQDAIVVKGEVVREFPLKSVRRKLFSHGIALKFTEMTDDNLKFFSGNLATEWKKDYGEDYHVEQREPAGRENKNRYYPILVLALILLLPLFYFSFISYKERVNLQQITTLLDGRLHIIEEQLQPYQQANDSLTHIGEEINDLQKELASYKSQLPTTDTLETMIKQLDDQKRLIEQISDEIERYQKPASTGSGNGSQVQKEHYYVVKTGENLYRISLKTGIKVRELRRLNNLEPNDTIFPGQKLTIK